MAESKTATMNYHAPAEGAPGTLRIQGERCEFSRLIVSLSKKGASGGAQWLTPLGWRAEAKSVALAADNTPRGLEIAIPPTHAAEIVDGDTLHLVCKELGIESRTTVRTGTPVAASGPVDASSVSVERLSAAPAAVPSDAAEATGSGARRLALLGVPALALAAGLGWVLTRGPADTPPVEQVAEVALPAEAELPVTVAPLPTEDEAAEDVPVEDVAIEDRAEEIEDRAEETGSDTADVVPEDNTPTQTEVAAEEDVAQDETEPDETEDDRIADDELAEDEVATALAPAPAPAPAPSRERIADVMDRKASDAEPDTAPKAASKAASIRTLQEDLTVMGYYFGPIDGELDAPTTSALKNFKFVFEIDPDRELDGPLLTRIARERAAFEATRDAEASKPALVPEPVSAPAIVAPAPIVAPEPVPSPEPEADADAPAAADDPASADAPVTAPVVPVLVSRDAPVYPDRAQFKRSIPDRITVTVNYDVGADGRVTRAEIADMSYDGKLFAKAFRKEAGRVARSQVFEALPAPVAGQTMRVTFQK